MEQIAKDLGTGFFIVQNADKDLINLVKEFAAKEFEINKDFLAMDFVDSILDQVQEILGKTSP